MHSFVPVRRSVSALARATAAIVLALGCQGDLGTEPVGQPRLAPSDALPTLTGGMGTQIFPTAPSGEEQPEGDARGLNASGQVTGGAFNLPSSASEGADAYRWTPGGTAVRLTPCCDSQAGNDINDAGTVVGVTRTAANEVRAFVATGTAVIPLPTLPGADPAQMSWAVAINNAGQIVGASPASGAIRRAVLWSPSGVPQDLGTFGGMNSAAVDINASGQVIGWSQRPDGTARNFLWSPGTGMVELDALIGVPNLVTALAINDAGQIAGTYLPDDTWLHAFLWTPGSGYRDLGVLDGLLSQPTGLNNKGDVVGRIGYADKPDRAFLWTAAEGMEDITAVTGITAVRQLNDNLQTLGGYGVFEQGPSAGPGQAEGRPLLLQLQTTQSNSPPTALFTVECDGLTCVLDASGSLDDKPGLSYAWDVNKYPGNTATGARVTVTYPHESQRTVTLTVTDASGLTDTESKTFTPSEAPSTNQPPVAQFTWSCNGTVCTLDATASTDDKGIVSYSWALGKSPDGTASGPTVTTDYWHEGPRSATLTVTDAEGLTHSVTKQVDVGSVASPPDAPPVARFTSSCSGTVCTLDASTSSDDNGIASYAWNLNKAPDGSATGVQVTTDYWHTSTRNVTLTVTDTKGQTHSVTQSVQVP